MNAIVDRRVFLGSAAALGAGLTVIDQAPRLLAEQTSPARMAAVTKDWAITHITDEAARLARALQSQPRPEQLLALAANFRFFDSYVREHRVDERVGTGMAELVSTRGRHAVIADAAGEQTAAHLRQLLDAAGVRPHMGSIPAAVYERQLDAILQKTALSALLSEGARALEAVYTAQQKKDATAGAHVMRIQNADLEQAFRCAHLNQQCSYYNSQAAFYCAMAYFFPPTAIVCAGLGFSVAGYCGAAHYYGC
jgi:hypothetical protein